MLMGQPRNHGPLDSRHDVPLIGHTSKFRKFSCATLEGRKGARESRSLEGEGEIQELVCVFGVPLT